MLVAAAALWMVQGVARGVPGPIVGGAYIRGPLDAFTVVANVASAIAMASVAAVLTTRAPGNKIGWIIGGLAVWSATTFFIIMVLYFLHAPGEAESDFANWFGNWSFVPIVGTSLILMVFPNGQLLSPRWRLLPWLAIIGMAAWVLLEATDATLSADESIPNPYSNAGLNHIAVIIGNATLPPTLIATIGSLIARYRQSANEARLQIKWVALGGLFQILMWILLWIWSVVWRETFAPIGTALGGLSLLVTPIALGAAILRYRLYEIDRLVSRTVSYAVLASILAVTYLAGVIGFQAVIPSSGDLAVAGTTLAIAAIFNPLRHRLQLLMDRKFNRHRFEVQRVIDEFTSRMETLSQTEALAIDLSETVRRTLDPASVGVWISPQPR